MQVNWPINRTPSVTSLPCAEHLKSAGIAGDVYAMGGSAGGLLMGAVMNQRPDLWAWYHCCRAFC